MNPEQTLEIDRLRALNLSPKQIARKLGLSPAEVNEYLITRAEGSAIIRQEKGELSPLERCLINKNAAKQLIDSQNKGWFGFGRGKDDGDDGVGGLAQIFVTRKEGNQYLVCSYLVDYWCLGVKNALGPRKLDRSRYETMIRACYGSFAQDYREISLEQAQAIIFGSIEYAAKLGLKPHADFEKAKAHYRRTLGQFPEDRVRTTR
jgi:hypothetical protein